MKIPGLEGNLMDTKKTKEIVISESKDLLLASNQLLKRGLDIVSEINPHKKHVPRDYPTIAEALDHAANGDTIELADGIYRESLKIMKPIEIVGTANGQVVLESPSFDPIITYQVFQGTSKLKNIIIRRTSEQNLFLGIDVHGNFFEFENCRFEGFYCTDEYMSNCEEKYWDFFENNTAVRIGQSVLSVKFSFCNFFNCEKGILVQDRSCIDLNSCNFSSTDVSKDIYGPFNIAADENCKIKSTRCSFSNGSIQLGLHSVYESSYDTFIEVKGIIHPKDTCQSTFTHATFVSNYLFEVAIPEGSDIIVRNISWPKGKPKIHFSNSIVFVKAGYVPQTYYTPAGFPLIHYDCSSIFNLVDEGIMTYADNNLLCMPPHFHCEDPLLMIENNLARLSVNSLAINSASDGTNIGAWQG